MNTKAILLPYTTLIGHVYGHETCIKCAVVHKDSLIYSTDKRKTFKYEFVIGVTCIKHAVI